ncbi:hypothetical protein KsCSTR_16030 [Candidatus Kuenenia stuttgartiensis]|uniref:Uncharacterized protein n=1 Tax=Kuenenia stuttgartiensis TaxID=174633 RepID=Q1Q1S6_KUEST|nr:hypothetical protein KsCSTR_16030 [Candidatus Kuenenia stuttgartiensis]CAJ73959.1 unknown protein [Candidatus Kuenenia stuttgartiensis]
MFFFAKFAENQTRLESIVIWGIILTRMKHTINECLFFLLYYGAIFAQELGTLPIFHKLANGFKKSISELLGCLFGNALVF